jgi:hypothetical protein
MKRGGVPAPGAAYRRRNGGRALEDAGKRGEKTGIGSPTVSRRKKELPTAGVAFSASQKGHAKSILGQ